MNYFAYINLHFLLFSIEWIREGFSHKAVLAALYNRNIERVFLMEKKILFPQLGGLLHGGDYNPDQWLDRPDILAEDVELMKKAGINCVSLGIFSWASYEPREGEFHFDWMEKIMDNLYQNGIYTILATPTGARPAWLDAAYPEVRRVDDYGIRYHHRSRHNHCMSSPVYREKMNTINRKLAERFSHHPGMLMWHISNEFGGECFCPLCAKRFQDYLADKFDHDINKLNKAWWTAFWSHQYNSFDQIEPPYQNGEQSVLGLNLEWKRFTTWSMVDCMKEEIRTVREINPDIPVTANLMKLYEGLDYYELAKELDVVSWDNYPVFHNDYETFDDTLRESAFDHAVMRSLKRDKPFMLMESAPGLTNWMPYNKLKRPGVHKLACAQAVASGSDTVQYFQIRKGRGSFEQFHGAVIDHSGADNRVYREVAETGALLKNLAPVAGTTVKADVALLFDWDNRWAIKDMKGLHREDKNYEATCIDMWREMHRLGVDVDVTTPRDDLSQYKVILAPMLYMLHPGTAQKLTDFVKGGGQLLATYLTGYVDENLLCFLGGFPGNGLSDLFGIYSEEIDTLYPTDRNALKYSDSGVVCEIKDYCEILKIKDAVTLAKYQQDFYENTPAVTVKNHGAGNAYYVAARIAAKDMVVLYEKMLEDAGIVAKKPSPDIEYHVRSGEEGTYEFYLNLSDKPVIQENVYGFDLASQETITGTLHLDGYGVAVVKR